MDDPALRNYREAVTMKTFLSHFTEVIRALTVLLLVTLVIVLLISLGVIDTEAFKELMDYLKAVASGIFGR